MTQHDTHDIVRTSCIAATAATLAATGLLAITADGMFRFAIDTQSKSSIFRRNLIAPDRNEKMNMGEAKEAGEWFEQAKQPVRIVSSDGLRMHGWLFDPDCAAPLPHAYAICVHGYTGAPAEMAKWAHRYARLGFTVLTPAQRGHELSEGRYVGMGWLERNDLLDWIRLIVASDPDARILLYGGSMGASTVMNTVGDPRLPRNVVAGIAESGYSSARDEFIDMAHSMFHLPRLVAAACVDAAGLICRKRAGYDFTEASCVKSLKHAVVPMLFIHGGGDRMVSPRFLAMNYNACSSIDRERLLVPGADHMESSAVTPDTYWHKVEGFIRRTFDLQ